MTKNNLIYKEYEILSKEELAPETFLFKLKGQLKFKPGQFIQAALDHFGEITLAPCSDPAEKNFFELCIRNNGNTSGQMTKLLVGEKLKVRGPYGNGWPTSKLLGKNIVIIAGGMGIVPLRPLILGLERKKIRLGKLQILIGTKTPEQILFEPDIHRWIKRFKAGIIAEYANHKFYGEKGLITELIDKRRFSHLNSTVLMCGPEIMYSFCNEALAKKGINDKQIYTSYERRMECGIGACQHCSCGKYLVCQDGPIFRLDQIKGEIGK